MNKNLLKLIMIATILTIFMLLNPYRLVVVLGNSMYPTYKNGQILLAKKVDIYNKEDVVVAHEPLCGRIIKRIKFVPGDRYYFYLDGKNIEFTIDNQYHNVNSLILSHHKIYENVVSKDKYFLVGDNTNNSEDSRSFGTIEKEDILYKIVQ